MQRLLSSSGVHPKPNSGRDDRLARHRFLHLTVPVCVGRGQHSVCHVDVRLVHAELDARIRAGKQARGSLGRVGEEARRVDLVRVEIRLEFCSYAAGEFLADDVLDDHAPVALDDRHQKLRCCRRVVRVVSCDRRLADRAIADTHCSGFVYSHWSLDNVIVYGDWCHAGRLQRLECSECSGLM